MLLSVERDVLMMQEEAVKPPPASTAASGPRATDFSIAAIMARESPGQLPAACASTAASASSASGESPPCLHARRRGAPARSPLPRGRRRWAHAWERRARGAPASSKGSCPRPPSH
ncbi:unnamed protein product, partial [Ixodes hexagonus]